MIKHKTFYLLLLALLITCTGCWDLTDITDRAYITAIGLDQPDNPLSASSELPNRYKVTAEILVPNLLKEAPWRLEKEKDKGSIVYTVEGESIQKALTNLQTRIPIDLSLAHLNVLIIGEKLAQEGLKNSFDFFERQPQVARRLRVFQTQNCQAQDILNLTPRFFRYISIELATMSLLESKISITRYESFSNLLKEMRSNKGISLGTRLILSEEETYIRHGASVINDWKLIGWLNKDETRHANWLKGKGLATVIGQSEEGIFTYQIEDRKVKILPKVENNTISFAVELKTRGSIWQAEESNFNFGEPKNIKKLEELFNRVIKKEIEDAIHKAQKDFKIDYLGFGMKLFMKHPQVYKNIDWEKTFPNVPIEVQVKSTISRFGQAR